MKKWLKVLLWIFGLILILWSYISWGMNNLGKISLTLKVIAWVSLILGIVLIGLTFEKSKN